MLKKPVEPQKSPKDTIFFPSYLFYTQDYSNKLNILLKYSFSLILKITLVNQVDTITFRSLIQGLAPVQVQNLVLGLIEPHKGTYQGFSGPSGWLPILQVCQLHHAAWRCLQTCRRYI